MEEECFEKARLEEGTRILRPTRYMRSPPGVLKRKLNKSLKGSPESMTCYLKKIIRKQCRIYNKVTDILNGSPPASLDTSNKLPMKASRLSPFVYRHIKLKPLPSQTPQPTKAKKSTRIKEKAESRDENIGILSVSTKLLIERSGVKKKIKKIEVGIGTKEDSFLECDDYNEDDEIGEYFMYKGCLS